MLCWSACACKHKHVLDFQTMYVLYKNPIQLDTLAIVQYLHAQGVGNVLPTHCVERSHPAWVVELPAILDMDTNKRFVGFVECVKYFENMSATTDLVNKAHVFKTVHPTYRVNNNT